VDRSSHKLSAQGVDDSSLCSRGGVTGATDSSVVGVEAVGNVIGGGEESAAIRGAEGGDMGGGLGGVDEGGEEGGGLFAGVEPRLGAGVGERSSGDVVEGTVAGASGEGSGKGGGQGGMRGGGDGLKCGDMSGVGGINGQGGSFAVG